MEKKSAMTSPFETPSFIRIEPGRSWSALNVKELWDFRELLYFLVWRDVKVRYKQTAIGAAWSIIQPLLTMIVFTVVFGKFANMPSDGLPYPIFSLCRLATVDAISRERSIRAL